MKLTREFKANTVSSIVGGVILAGMGWVAREIMHGVYSVELPARAMLVVLYIGLVLGAAFIISSRRQSQFDPNVRVPRFGRWLKVVTVLTVLAGIGPLVWAFLPCSIPALRILVRNQSQHGILLPDQVEFFVMVPQSPSSQGIAATGRCRVSWFPSPQQRDKPLVIVPDETAQFHCNILNPRAYQRYLEAEYMDLELYLSDNNGKVVSGQMAFNRHALQEHWMAFEFK